jgi:hypothetical protein
LLRFLQGLEEKRERNAIEKQRDEKEDVKGRQRLGGRRKRKSICKDSDESGVKR